MKTLAGPGKSRLHWTWQIIPPALLSILAVLSLVACGGAGPTPTPTATIAPTPTSTPTPLVSATNQLRSVRLPEDEGAHSTPLEWWYFNGHLTDNTGMEYSYHFVAFRVTTPSGLTPWLLQLSWADHPRGLHLTDEKVSLQTAEVTPGRFDIPVSGWQMRGDSVNYNLVFDTGGYSLDLKAASLKPAALHDGDGLVALGPAGESYYYSHTRLEIAGTLTVHGERRAVTGISWMDHQWGDFSPVRVGWDWMSLQFDDRSELMMSLVWDPVNRQPFATYGTYVVPDATLRYLDGAGITLTATGSWTSPTTGVQYPMGWELEVTSLALKLMLKPVQQQAEFGSSRYVPAAYWEGAVSVVGVKEGSAVTGKGFVELVGYDPGHASSSFTGVGQ